MTRGHDPLITENRRTPILGYNLTAAYTAVATIMLRRKLKEHAALSVLLVISALAQAQTWTPLPAAEDGLAMTWKKLCASSGPVGTWTALVSCATGFTASQFSASCTGTYDGNCTGRCGPIVWSHVFMNNTSQSIIVKGATASSTSKLVFYANGNSIGSYSQGTNIGSWEWLPGLNFTVRGGSPEACVSGGWVTLHLSNGQTIRGTATTGGLVYNNGTQSFKYTDTITVGP